MNVIKLLVPTDLSTRASLGMLTDRNSNTSRRPELAHRTKDVAANRTK